MPLQDPFNIQTDNGEALVFNDLTGILTGSDDPTVTDVRAPGDTDDIPASTLYIRYGATPQLYQKQSTGALDWTEVGSGSGDVSGPGSSTDDAIVRWDGATGQLVQNSNAILDDTGNVDFAGTITGGDLRIRHDTLPAQDLIIDANGRSGATGASISRDGPSGFLWWFPNATTAQWLIADPASGAGVNRMFIDVDMQGDLFLQTLGGAGAGADIIATSGGNLRPDVDTTSNLGTASFRWGDVRGVDLYGDTLRLSNALGDTVTVQVPVATFTDYNLVLPGDDGDAGQVLSTDGSGNLSWVDDQFVKVSANDTTPGVLNGKLVAGTGINFVENNDGGNETLTINATSAISIQGVWQYDNATAATNPGAGNFRINNTNPALATALFISDETKTGVDFSTILGAVQIGDVVYFQNTEDGGEAIIATISSVTDNGSWWNFGLSVFDSSGSSFTSGKEFGFVFALGVVNTDTGITQLTGDVTAGPGSGSQVATIADDAVTYAKIQNVVADNVLLGNNSGAGSVVEELTATEVRTILNVEDGAAADQNLFETVNADTGSTTADSTTDTLTIAGGTDIETEITGDTVTINNTRVFGTEFQRAEDLGISITTSTTFQNKVTLTTSSLPAGTYRVQFSYGWNHDATNSDFEGQLTEDASQLGELHKQEPKDAGGGGTTGTTQRYYASRTWYRTLTAGVHTYEINFRTDDADDESSIWEAVIELWRVA